MMTAGGESERSVARREQQHLKLCHWVENLKGK